MAVQQVIPRHHQMNQNKVIKKKRNILKKNIFYRIKELKRYKFFKKKIKKYSEKKKFKNKK